MRDLRPVPGILAPDPSTDRLVWGALAGRVRWQPMDEWKHGLCLVARSALTPALRSELGLRLPEERIAADHPGARAAIAALPGLAISGELTAALRRAGCPLCAVHYTRHTGTLTLTAIGWGVPVVRISVLAHELPGSPLEGIDRLISAATGGVLSELAVRGADYACKHIDRLLVDDRVRHRRQDILAEEAALEAELIESMGAELAAEVFAGFDGATLRPSGFEVAPAAPEDAEAAQVLIADILTGRRTSVSVGGQRYAVHHRPSAVICGLAIPSAVVAYGST